MARFLSAVEEKRDFLGSYSLSDREFGTVVTVTVDSINRTIVTNALPNHETGKFPNAGNPNTIREQSLIYIYPVNPNYIGNARFAQIPGVAVNGVPFEPGTAESVVCESGESYRIEALQEVYDQGVLLLVWMEPIPTAESLLQSKKLGNYKKRALKTSSGTITRYFLNSSNLLTVDLSQMEFVYERWFPTTTGPHWYFR